MSGTRRSLSFIVADMTEREAVLEAKRRNEDEADRSLRRPWRANTTFWVEVQGTDEQWCVEKRTWKQSRRGLVWDAIAGLFGW